MQFIHKYLFNITIWVSFHVKERKGYYYIVMRRASALFWHGICCLFFFWLDIYSWISLCSYYCYCNFWQIYIPNITMKNNINVRWSVCGGYRSFFGNFCDVRIQGPVALFVIGWISIITLHLSITIERIGLWSWC